MKIACNKCLTVRDTFWTRDWLEIRADGEIYMLCEKCKDGFYMAIDSSLPPIVKYKEVNENE